MWTSGALVHILKCIVLILLSGKMFCTVFIVWFRWKHFMYLYSRGSDSASCSPWPASKLSPSFIPAAAGEGGGSSVFQEPDKRRNKHSGQAAPGSCFPTDERPFLSLEKHADLSQKASGSQMKTNYKADSFKGTNAGSYAPPPPVCPPTCCSSECLL